MEQIFPYTSTLHTLAAVIWVGGMVFAWGFLRPALGFLEPPQRLGVWFRVFPKFFFWVWLAVVIMPASGYMMVYYDFGSFEAAGHHVVVMHAIGWVMVALFLFLFFVPYRKFKQAVIAETWPAAAAQLALIRRIVATNMILGLFNIIAGVSGRFWG